MLAIDDSADRRENWEAETETVGREKMEEERILGERDEFIFQLFVSKVPPYKQR